MKFAHQIADSFCNWVYAEISPHYKSPLTRETEPTMKKPIRPTRRRSLRRLRDLFFQPAGPQLARRNNSFRFETLEGRMMLAGDLGLDLTPLDQAGPVTTDAVTVAASYNSFYSGPEGEDAPEMDLVAFAKALDAAGARLFGAVWCPACNTQKELFEDGDDFLPFVDVTNPDRTQNPDFANEQISAYPTWEFPDGTREVGVLSLAEIAQRSNITIPTSSMPFVAPIGDILLDEFGDEVLDAFGEPIRHKVVMGGSPLHLALDGYDPNGGPLTFTVESSNPDLVAATVFEDNPSASIIYGGWGEVVVQLFDVRAPEAAGRFIELAEAGFYNLKAGQSPITVHRSIDGFMMQFGDPNGDGTGGSDLGDFDDNFHPDLQHGSDGVISWAKAGDDTNDSQVFITDTATRFLDFNHSVFGLVTDGNKVRDAITGTATDASDRPLYPVNIQSVSIFDDEENAVLMLKAAERRDGHRHHHGDGRGRRRE